MRKQFVKSLQDILYSDEKTALFLGDIGVFGFRNELKNISNRVYNIGILEQSTISLAAGLSKMGIVPFVHTIAPFMVERALEQIKIDFGYQELKGNFISIGASYDYSSLGCTHHCCGDIQILTSIPNMQIVVPGTSAEFDHLIKQTYNNNFPTYFRLSEFENKETYNFEFGKAKVIKKGKLATIICFGNMLDSLLDSCSQLDVTILYYNTIFPFDSETLIDNFNKNIIVCEPFYEGSVNYMITSALGEKLYTITNIGIPRIFLKNYGSKHEHDINNKIDSINIKERVLKCLKL